MPDPKTFFVRSYRNWPIIWVMIAYHLKIISVDVFKLRHPLDYLAVDSLDVCFQNAVYDRMWQVGGFPRVLRFPPPIKLTSNI
jgi:hypothetical protein